LTKINFIDEKHGIVLPRDSLSGIRASQDVPSVFTTGYNYVKRNKTVNDTNYGE